MKSKCQQTIKARSLNVTLLTIIIICHFYVIAGAGQLGRGGCTRYTKTLRDVREHYEISPSKPPLLVAQTDKYNDNLSEGLSVINDMSTMTTWVKDYQLSTIRWRQSKWRVISYQQCDEDDLSEGLSVIDDTVQQRPVWLFSQLMPWWLVWSLACVPYDLCGCWSVWPMIYEVAGLYSLWPIGSLAAWPMTYVVYDLSRSTPAKVAIVDCPWV